MLYPFNQKFLLWDDIKSSLNGIARIIEFRCFYYDKFNKPDPTVDQAKKYKWILSMSEGSVKKGLLDGFNRVICAYNGHTRYGYFK